MKNTSIYFFLFLACQVLTSCHYLLAFRMMNEEEIIVDRIVFDDKQIFLVPIVHFGERQFYASLKDSINQWKHQGYRIYYEGIKSSAVEMNVDSAVADTLFRKFRHITGGSTADSLSYAQLTQTFKGKMVQPSFEDLGVDSSDLNADISMLAFIREYEKMYEEIQLLKCDWTTPRDGTYECKKQISNGLKPIVRDYRNQYVIETIRNSNDYRIVVIFGAGHMKGISALLKKMD